MALKRPKDKGTREETAVKRSWVQKGFRARREQSGWPWDVTVDAPNAPVTPPKVVEVLTFRTDRGERMTLLRHEDFQNMTDFAEQFEIHEEVKRFARSALYTTFLYKFGRKR